MRLLDVTVFSPETGSWQIVQITTSDDDQNLQLPESENQWNEV